MAKPSVDSLEQLFTAVVQELTNAIKNGEANAATLGVATKLLKDNNITAVIEDNSALQEMQKRLAAQQAKREGKHISQVPAPSSPVTEEEKEDAVEAAMNRQKYGA